MEGNSLLRLILLSECIIRSAGLGTVAAVGLLEREAPATLVLTCTTAPRVPAAAMMPDAEEVS